jgi:hypothetical protein
MKIHTKKAPAKGTTYTVETDTLRQAHCEYSTDPVQATAHPTLKEARAEARKALRDGAEWAVIYKPIEFLTKGEF